MDIDDSLAPRLEGFILILFAIPLQTSMDACQTTSHGFRNIKHILDIIHHHVFAFPVEFIKCGGHSVML